MLGGWNRCWPAQPHPGAVQFAGSDAYFDEEELPLATERCAGGESRGEDE